MSKETETIQLNEKEYRAFEALAKKYGFKGVNELATTATVLFLSDALGGNIKPEDTEEFLDKLTEEHKKNPNFNTEEFIRNFKATPKIETVEITVRIPKKLLAFAKNIRPDTIAYLSDLLTDSIAADLMTGDYGDSDTLKNEYDMNQEFQFYEGH